MCVKWSNRSHFFLRWRLFLYFSSSFPSSIKMFEARIKTASILKRIVDALKELVTDANWDCSAGGIRCVYRSFLFCGALISALNALGFNPPVFRAWIPAMYLWSPSFSGVKVLHPSAAIAA